MFVFFFSSRRRHTRSKRDWSSDVCSSDLQPGASRDAGTAGGEVRDGRDRRDRRAGAAGCPVREGAAGKAAGQGVHRSEERRVGKEGRTGGGPDQYKERRREIRSETGYEGW